MEKEKLRNKIEKMTLEEKVQLCSGADFWHTKEIEHLAIPALTMSDGPSGLRKQDGSGNMGLHESQQSVSFPSGSLVASSFDREVLKRLGKTLGKECQAAHVDILLGPSMNIKRSPLCGRNFEYYSEDPYVSGELAGSYIDGLQSMGVGACPKHFYANNMEERRMSTSSELEQRTAREIYLASFERVVKEHQPYTIMCSYNKINGVYAAENKEALTDILRKEWGFEGSVVSDWGAVNDRAADLKAGLDLEMPYSHGAGERSILKAIEKGEISEEELDERVYSLLKTIARCTESKKPVQKFDWQSDHDIASKIARESMVLLKNDGVLPLSKEKIVFIGPYAKEPRFQGGGSSHVQPWKVEAAWDLAKERENISYVQGFVEEGDYDEDLVKEAISAVQKADVAVLFAGLPESWESEGFDREHLRLPENQTMLIEALSKTKTKLVVVLHNGAPVEMPWIHQVDAVLESYLGGEAVGAAQMDLLFGQANPCGHLAETFPIRLEDTPSYLNFRPECGKVSYREGVFVGYRYYDRMKKSVLFPFGHGLSYTTFGYTNLVLDQTELRDSLNLQVSVDVTNTGDRSGKEVVQLYVRSCDSEVLRPIKELRGFEKIELQPKETQTVTFYLTKRDFAYWDEDLCDWCVPSGDYQILIGRSAEDIRVQKTVVIHTEEKKRKITKDTAIGDLHPEQIQKVMAPFRKRKSGDTGDSTVSDKASQSLQMNMPLRSLVSFGAMKEEELMKLLEELN